MAGDAIGQLLPCDASLVVAGFDFLQLVLVAAIAGIGCIIHRVTGLAVSGGAALFAAVADRKCVLAQVGGRPGSRGMAVLALQAESAGVDLRFLMTLDAFGWRVAEARAADCVGVAALAFYVGMLTIQYKNCIMGKTAQPIPPVMAVQASGAKLCLMLLHERRVSDCMTVDAALHAGSFAAARPVTGLAVHRYILKV